MTIENLGVKLYSGTKSDRVSDSLGSSADGTNSNITLDTTNKKLGTGCYSFNDSSSRVAIIPTGLVPANNYTISCWARINSSTDSGDAVWRMLIGSSFGVTLYYTSTGTMFKVEWGSAGSGNITTSAISQDTWYHVVLVNNGGTFTLYLNGVSQGTGSTSSVSSSTSITIGSDGTSNYFGGLIDDFGIWSRSLSTTEISDLYNSGSGALVSSLSNKANLKAYYSMDSTSLEALKNTPDYTFNFSSNTDWTQTTSGTSNTVYIDTSAGHIRHNTTTNTSAMKKVYYDLTNYTSGSAVNDSKWTMRFKWVVTSQNVPSSWLMALSGNTTDPDSTSWNGIGIQLNDEGGSYGYHIATCDGSTKTFSSNVTTPSNSQTLYFELKRTLATNATLTCWSDSYGGTQVGTTQSLTIPSGVTTLKYLQSGSGQGGNSSRTMNATLDDLEIFDDSIQLDGCANDFSTTSALEALTGVRTNSIFQQTDDTPSYWWKQSDNTWKGSTIPSISDEYLHYDFAGEQSTIVMDGSNRVSKVTDGFGTTERDLVQATSGNQPLFIANNVNDLGVVDFDGDRYMKTASALTAISQPITIFTLVEFLDQSVQESLVLDGHGASNRYNHCNHFATDKVRSNAGANLDTGTITGLDESNVLFTTIYNGGSSDIRINGVSVKTGNVGSGSYAGISCGTNSSSSNFWNAKFMEIAIYEKAVSGDELTKMENYFLNRWGLS